MNNPPAMIRLSQCSHEHDVCTRIAKSRSIEGDVMFDFLIVGAGFAGSVLAERLASQDGAQVLLMDRRSHIGGNEFDVFDDAGILVHRYGPHIFHTNAAEIVEYPSQFTPWRPYAHRVLASVEGRLVLIPINLDTINTLLGLSLS
jgi:UDP-galactopyranose mutase